MITRTQLFEDLEPVHLRLWLSEVPGIEDIISKLRRSYPSLTDEAISRILGLPSGEVPSTKSKTAIEVSNTEKSTETKE